MDKNAIAAIFDELGLLLTLQGANPFKIRAYENASRRLLELEEPLGTLLEDEARFRELTGIGADLTAKVRALHTTGKLDYYEKQKAAVPEGLLEVAEIPGLGGKKILKLWKELGITGIEDLRRACQEGRVAQLTGFGARSQEKILQGIDDRLRYAQRHLWWNARAIVEPLLAGLRRLPEVHQAEIAGSYRRGRETVGDLDFIVASESPLPIMRWFTEGPDVDHIIASGETKSSVFLKSGIQADLRVVPLEAFGATLHYFTGSRDHNIRMRRRALERGLSLSEWGLRPVPESDSQEAARPLIPCPDENDVFRHLGLPWIDPALREDNGEIASAEAGELPNLIETSDLRGAFHNHTTASDGRSTLLEMAAAAEKLGWDYLGIADHSKSSFQANGLDASRVRQLIADIRALNESGKFRVRILAGIEVDILADGSLDFEDDILAELDYTVASVHNALTQNAETMTRRIIRALENPLVTILGHPTGRLLLRREPSAVDLPQVIDAAIAHGTIIELNASPYRLDMDWRLWRHASARGLLCAINPDAHDTEGLRFVEAGVRIARKGWLSPQQVLNTRPLDEVLTYFARKRNSLR